MKAGLTQQQLAEQAGMSGRYISEIENVDINLTLEMLEKLAQGLGVRPGVLLGEAGDGSAPHSADPEAIPGLRYALNSIRSALSTAEAAAAGGQPSRTTKTKTSRRSKTRRKKRSVRHKPTGGSLDD
jgi:transcriptional regulator with XRE-family HTH domain